MNVQSSSRRAASTVASKTASAAVAAASTSSVERARLVRSCRSNAARLSVTRRATGPAAIPVAAAAAASVFANWLCLGGGAVGGRRRCRGKRPRARFTSGRAPPPVALSQCTTRTAGARIRHRVHAAFPQRISYCTSSYFKFILFRFIIYFIFVIRPPRLDNKNIIVRVIRSAVARRVRFCFAGRDALPPRIAALQPHGRRDEPTEIE